MYEHLCDADDIIKADWNVQHRPEFWIWSSTHNTSTSSILFIKYGTEHLAVYWKRWEHSSNTSIVKPRLFCFIFLVKQHVLKDTKSSYF